MQEFAHTPPRKALRFLRWYCRPDRLEEIEGDLEEVFHSRWQHGGIQKARRLFWWDVIRCFRPYAWRKDLFQPDLFLHFPMFGNYFKTSSRNLLKNKAFAVINIFGLALSMSVCLLIMLIVKDQYQIDKHNRQYDRVYRILTYTTGNDREVAFATSPLPLGEVIKASIPQAQVITQFVTNAKADGFANNKALPFKGIFADAQFMQVMDYALVRGDFASALADPYSVVLTSRLAEKYFGQEDPIGKILRIKPTGKEDDQGKDCLITGVLQDEALRTHIGFDLLISFATMPLLEDLPAFQTMLYDWNSFWQGYHYLLLDENADVAAVAASLNQAAAPHLAESTTRKLYFALQPLSDVTPYDESVMNPPGAAIPAILIYFLGGLGLVILFSAGFNYTNLSIARSLSRGREVGIRKVTGANKGQVVMQFLVEAIMVAFLALLLALGMLRFLEDAFFDIDPYLVNVFQIKYDFFTFFLFILFALAVGIGAGLLPSVFMARFQPMKVLKGIHEIPGRQKFTGRHVLTLVQFVLSMVFIQTAYVAYQQFSHVMNAELGLRGDRVVCIPMKGNSYEQVEQAFASLAIVENMGACTMLPNTNTSSTSSLKLTGAVDSISVYANFFSPSFFEVMHLKLLTGRNFAAGQSASGKQVLLNEQAVTALGFNAPGEAIGQWVERDGHFAEVIGVMKDFVFNGIQAEIAPLVVYHDPENFYELTVRLKPGDLADALVQLEYIWQKLDPVHPFEYVFYEDELARSYLEYQALIKIVGFTGFLSMVIACLGLLGMVIFNTAKHQKEIGVRKVHGASAVQVTVLLSKSFLSLVLLAAFLALPAAYYLNLLWLSYYPYRIDFNLLVLLPGVMVVLLAGLLAVAPHSMKAARSNPAEALRSE